MKYDKREALRMYRSLFAVCFFLTLGPYSCKHELTPEEVRTLHDLRTELNQVTKEIDEAQAKERGFNGGILKALITVRVEILKTTEALLQQRIHAIEAGGKITVETKASLVNENEVTRLEEAIKTQETVLHQAQEDAAKYAGGLIQALKLSTVTTQEQSLAMLRQRHLIAKFGLAVPTYPDLSGHESSKEARASVEKTEALPSPVAAASHDADVAEKTVVVRLLKKQFTKQDYQEYLFFDLEFSAVGLDKPARSIKGTLSLNDLFGESKMHINWTIDKPIEPGGKVVEKGTGFKFNQFMDSHQWAKGAELENITASFIVSSILYQDGTRRDLQ